jgi:hypothetical protein
MRLTSRMNSKVCSVAASVSTGGATMKDSSGTTPCWRHNSTTASVWSERVPLRMLLSMASLGDSAPM